jgi:hypothetical protein
MARPEGGTLKVRHLKKLHDAAMRRTWRSEWFLRAVARTGYFPGNVVHLANLLPRLAEMRAVGMIPHVDIKLNVIPHTGRLNRETGHYVEKIYDRQRG